MGTDFSIRPAGAPVAALNVRPAPEAVRTAVPTELPSDKTVAAANPLPRPGVPATSYQQLDSDRISQGIIIDKDAAAIVFVSIDKATNQVINQYPEASRLRARAYLRAMDSKQEDRRIETDRTA